jgi:hypothetical protein
LIGGDKIELKVMYYKQLFAELIRKNIFLIAIAQKGRKSQKRNDEHPTRSASNEKGLL